MSLSVLVQSFPQHILDYKAVPMRVRIQMHAHVRTGTY